MPLRVHLAVKDTDHADGRCGNGVVNGVTVATDPREKLSDAKGHDL
jgi:hypothetical protein